jgi:hypothetical protein
MTAQCTEKETLKRLESKIDQVLTILNGNGRVGLKTQVTLHKTYFKVMGAILLGLIVKVGWAWITKL